MLEGVYDPNSTNGLPSGWKARVTAFEVPDNPVAGNKILDRIEVQIWWVVSGQTQTFQAEGFRRAVLTQQDIEAGGLLPR
jgi:hypothetical protein